MIRNHDNLIRPVNIYPINYFIVIVISLASATIVLADQREEKLGEIRQQIKKKIGEAGLELLNATAKKLYTLQHIEAEKISIAQEYFRGGKVDPLGKKVNLYSEYLSIKGALGMILIVEIYDDDVTKQFTQTYYEALVQSKQLQRRIEDVRLFDKEIGYDAPLPQITNASDFFGEYRKRIPKLHEYIQKIFRSNLIPDRYLTAIKQDASYLVWETLANAYFIPKINGLFDEYRVAAENLNETSK